MERFKKVSDRFYRGSCPVKELKDIDFLKNSIGIDTVLSLDIDCAKEIQWACSKNDIEQIVIPLFNGRWCSNIELIVSLFDYLSDKTVFVHCKHGKDRTGMICAMYEIYSGAETLEGAIEKAVLLGMGTGMTPRESERYVESIIRYHDSIQDDTNNIDDNIFGIYNSFGPIDVMGPSISSPIMNKLNSLRVLSPFPVSENKVWYYPGACDFSKWKNVYTGIVSGDVFRVEDVYSPNKVLEIFESIDYGDVLPDAFLFLDSAYILNDDSLVNVKKDTANDLGEDTSSTDDIPYNNGVLSTYEGIGLSVFPGSGGFMDAGYGGFAGFVNLPFGNFSFV